MNEKKSVKVQAGRMLALEVAARMEKLARQVGPVYPGVHQLTPEQQRRLEQFGARIRPTAQMLGYGAASLAGGVLGGGIGAGVGALAAPKGKKGRGTSIGTLVGAGTGAVGMPLAFYLAKRIGEKQAEKIAERPLSKASAEKEDKGTELEKATTREDAVKAEEANRGGTRMAEPISKETKQDISALKEKGVASSVSRPELLEKLLQKLQPLQTVSRVGQYGLAAGTGAALGGGLGAGIGAIAGKKGAKGKATGKGAIIGAGAGAITMPLAYYLASRIANKKFGTNLG